ncbi:hypothetical protein IGI39_003332 [Enterococcus sp. AZ135]|uniref:DUF1642 domain-containing protein n=1 Tax=unclassified Enterococcus TaxID=2608891 RepID=UPI003F270471
MNKQDILNQIEWHLKETEGENASGTFDQGYKEGCYHCEALIEQLDEPQKVKVKQYVADWYEEHKHNLSNSLWEFTVELNKKTKVMGALYTEFESWFIEHPRAYEFISSMRNGYEVEQEPKYTVAFEGKGDQLNYRIALFGFNSHGKPCIGFSKRSNLTPVCKDEMLTELEIKSYDERLWTFAVPVEKV